MIEFDEKKTADFFNGVFARTNLKRRQDSDDKLHTRDRILMERILPTIGDAAMSIIDYGCGQGRLLRALIESGYDATGIEKHEEMGDKAVASLKGVADARERVITGSIESLAEMPDASVDMFVAMGVFQYLSPEEYRETMAEARRLLRPTGHFIATFQNSLFDLFTFNRYTLDFIADGLLGSSLSEEERETVMTEVADLVENPGLPEPTEWRARDNIFVRMSNPLTITGDLDAADLYQDKIYFYDWFGLPPLLRDKHPELAARIAASFEIQSAESWQGHFMANAFLVHARPA